ANGSRTPYAIRQRLRVGWVKLLVPKPGDVRTKHRAPSNGELTNERTGCDRSPVYERNTALDHHAADQGHLNS
ncbi:MAG: hypothetical protein N3G20_10585, partial [Verrucomicrobiae bacterium]|nr:hypothetical protein [Verrucomicrobiae bacterium]